jgi:hypothetical protein
MAGRGTGEKDRFVQEMTKDVGGVEQEEGNPSAADCRGPSRWRTNVACGRMPRTMMTTRQRKMARTMGLPVQVVSYL